MSTVSKSTIDFALPYKVKDIPCCLGRKGNQAC